MKMYMVYSEMNPHLVLAENGEFLDRDMVGPGHDLGIRVYRYRASAEKVRNGYGIIVKEIETCDY